MGPYRPLVTNGVFIQLQFMTPDCVELFGLNFKTRFTVSFKLHMVIPYGTDIDPHSRIDSGKK